MTFSKVPSVTREQVALFTEAARFGHAHGTLLTLSQLSFTVREAFFSFGPHTP
jgi:hypothetical protein